MPKAFVTILLLTGELVVKFNTKNSISADPLLRVPTSVIYRREK